ncbi:MAG: protein translocase subunit SecD [Clostridia bacterium]|nr:protein translocase subunit SecD [Clostridia bacterium]
MKKKSIIILALMVVIAIVLNYVAFMGFTIGNFRYDSLFGDNVFGNKETAVQTAEQGETTEDAAENADTEETAAPQDGEAEAEEAADTAAETEEAADAEETAAPEETAEGEKAENTSEEAAKTETAKPEDKGRIRKGIDLAGGSVISFEVDTASEGYDPSLLTEANMDIVEAIFTTRMNAAGYTEARISRGELGQITVEIPSVFDTDSAASLLGSTAKLSFIDADGNVVLDGATDIKGAEHKYGQVSSSGVTAEDYVELTLTQEAVTKFAEATEKAAGASAEGKNYIAIMMDDNIISAPRVSSKIDSETCIISGDFTAETASELANQIKSGALPFAMKVMSQETIGAELGANALPTSLIAALIGILLVMLFMIFRYKISGLLADLALLYYIGIVALVLGIFRINLSLSGIAGIVLSIGMAVDANVIIFERMKEELRLGKTIKATVESSFHKAFSAILDSNITTIITCVVLYLSGIGTVRGFAITLGLGVVVSMLTAVVITKFLLKQLVYLNIKNRNALCAK